MSSISIITALPASPLAALSDEALAAEITLWGGRIAAAEAHLITLIGEFDERGAWGGPGLLSCAHWLSWRLGMGLVAARERVRVARQLRELPLVRSAFEAGQLSWTQVRAITRVHDPALEAQLVDLARHTTGAQLERVVRALVRNEQDRADAADPEAAEYRMRSSSRWDERGTLILTLRIPAADAQLALDALERFQAEVQAERDEAKTELDATADAARDASAEAPHPTSRAVRDRQDHEEWLAQKARQAQERASAEAQGICLRPATLGDALVRMAGAAPAKDGRRARAEVHIDPLSGWARTSRGELLTPSSLRELARSLPGNARTATIRPLHATDLTQHDRGRTSRLVSPALRRHLGVLDGERCRFPGCTRVHKLHAHHIRFWSLGGATDLANLVLVCERHHTLIHTQGFQLTLDEDRSLEVLTEDGTSVPHLHAPAFVDRAMIDPRQVITSRTLPPHGGDRIDLDYVVSVMLQHVA